MPAKRSLTLALALLLAIALPVHGATAPVLQQIDLLPGAASSSPGELVSFKNRVYFSANDGTHGQELWRTDGAADATHTGTELVCDLFSAPGYGSSPHNLTVLGDWLYFTADAGIARYRLYRTNGAVNSCELVTDVGDYGYSTSLQVVGDQLWFGAYGATGGLEPAMTTANSTPAMVLDINPSGNSYPSGFTKLGSYVYFAADDGVNGEELWRSNGIGAEMVANINAGGDSNPRELTAVGDTLYFSGYTAGIGTELMHADASGYGGAFDIYDGPETSNPSGLTNFKGQLYFSAFTPANGNELWRVASSGTAVERVTDINPGANSSSPVFLTPIGDWLYFSADDGATGNEVWRTNGTTTQMVKEIVPGTTGSYPFGFVEHSGAIFFIAGNGSTNTMFRTTGTAASTVVAVDSSGTNPYIGCECNTPIVFVGDRTFTYMGNSEYGFEVSFFDPELPSTDREGSGLLTALMIGAALTAAAGLTVRLRAARK
jgi:ELWxxDGT repeat protein